MSHTVSPPIAVIAAAFVLSACGQDATSTPGVTASLERSTIVTSDSSVVADGATLVHITVVPRDAAGRAITNEIAVRIIASNGLVSHTEWNGDSIYTANLTVPTNAGEDTISASIQGKPLAHPVAVRLGPGALDASFSEVFVNDSELLADGKAATRVFIAAGDSNGNRIDGLTVHLTTSAGAVSQASGVGDGLYLAWLTAGTTIETATLRASLSSASAPGMEERLAVVQVSFGDPSQWHLRADLPFPVENSAMVALNGALYNVGGDSVTRFDDWPVSDVEAYDPGADRWTARAPLPAPRSNLGAAVVGGKLYAMGGGDNDAFDDLWMYDPALDSWTAKAPMPTARSFLAVAALGSLIYAAGGATSDGKPSRIVEVYDPATDHWTQVAPLAKPRMNFALVAANGKLYAISNEVSLALIDVDEYDPTTNSWRPLPGEPDGNSGFAAAFIGGQIIILGGRGRSADGADGLVSCRAYGLTSISWQNCPPMHAARYRPAAAVLNGALYVAGGFARTEHGEGAISSVEEYTP